MDHDHQPCVGRVTRSGNPPTMDEYIVSAEELAKLVRKVISSGPKTVKKADIKKALDRFERASQGAMVEE